MGNGNHNLMLGNITILVLIDQLICIKKRSSTVSYFRVVTAAMLLILHFGCVRMRTGLSPPCEAKVVAISWSAEGASSSNI